MHDMTILLLAWVATLCQSCYNRSVTELLGQPCNKCDIVVKPVTSCEQVA